MDTNSPHINGIKLDSKQYHRFLELWGYTLVWLDERKILQWLPGGKATIEMNDLIRDVALRILIYEQNDTKTPSD